MLPVLDHGFVRLIDHMGSDLSVVRAARVSHNASWRAGADAGKDEKLIHYLMRNHHSTPFEHITFTFEIKAPIFVLRQWHRHRTWSYNEVSARYTELSNDFYIPNPETVGTQSTTNKQGRSTDASPHNRAEEIAWYKETCLTAIKIYHHLLSQDWPRELARGVLPLSVYSHMFATTNLWNLLHFLSLRRDGHSQWEIRQYAEAILTLARPIVPICIEAWELHKDSK